MYKLLTTDDRSRIEGEYRARRVRAALMLATALIVFSIAAASPALITALSRKNAAVLALLSAGSAEGSTEAATLLSWERSLRVELSALSPDTSAPHPYEDFWNVLKSRPAGVVVTSLVYAKAGNTLSIKGNASDRETLLTFENSLRTSGSFSQVNLPVDNLAKETNVDFNLTLTPNP